MSGSKMSSEIREQPEVLERILDEGWNEILETTHTKSYGSLREASEQVREDILSFKEQNGLDRIGWSKASLDSASVAAPGGARRRVRTRQIAANRARSATSWSTVAVSP